MAARATGKCLCESIRYEVHGPMRDIVNCHCSRCRRSTGHFMPATSVAVGDLVIQSDDTLRWYSPVARASYAFCGECGSTLFWRSTDTPDLISIAAGTLDPPTGLRTIASIYHNYASDYHRFDDEVPQYGEDWPGPDG